MGLLRGIDGSYVWGVLSSLLQLVLRCQHENTSWSFIRLTIVPTCVSGVDHLPDRHGSMECMPIGIEVTRPAMDHRAPAG